MSDTPPFVPSDIVIVGPFPFIGTLGHAERELAAALIVRTCQVTSNSWSPVSQRQIGESLGADVEASVEPWAGLIRNPFTPRPDFDELVKHGYATWTSERTLIALTPLALEAIGKRWRRAPEAPAAGCP